MPFKPKGKGIADTVRDSLEDALSNKTIFSIARRHVAPLTRATIDLRTQRGEYLGGSHAGKGYSTSPLPTFFFGDLEKSGSSYTISDPSGDRGNVSMSENQIQWGRKFGGGSGSTAWIKGGYKAFRKASGRDVSKVNLTWTGALLRQLESVPQITPYGARIVTSVNGSRSQIAGWLDKKRNFMGLSETEMETMETRIANLLMSEIRRS